MSNETEEMICPDCMEEISEYGRYTHEESGDVVCAGCYDNRNVINCYHCSNATTFEDLENGNSGGEIDEDGDWICGDHWTSCGWCSELMRDNNTCYINGTEICQSCYDEECRECGGCGETTSSDSLHWSDQHDDYVCESCSDDATDGVTSEHCPTCRTGNVHFDVLSERYVCTCAAMNLPFVRYRGGVRAVFYPTPAEELMHVGQLG